MKRKYEKPNIDITVFLSEDVITTSSTNTGLTDGGSNGSPVIFDFKSLFGDK